jgi:2',3'-cyclic-nucleotide 2'-phosphodiesterase (5'-nucleotidase family)
VHNRHLFHIIRVALAAWLAFCLIGCTNVTTVEAPPIKAKRITLLYFNDFHGHLLPFKRFYNDTELSGGFARMAYLVNAIRAENKLKNISTLLLSAGDNFQGTPISTAYRGEAEFAAFNLIGLNATVVGNHDFDYSDTALYDILNRAEFPVLSSNIYFLAGSDLVFEPYTISKASGGLRVGIIGLTTPETAITTYPAHVSDLRFTRPELALQQFLDVVKRRSDLVVILSHLGITEDRRIAGLFPEVDVIIGGHSHTLMSKPEIVGDVIVTHAGENGLFLGRLDLEIVGDDVRIISQQLLSIDNRQPEDSAMKALIDGFNDKLAAEIEQVVGRSDCFLNGERGEIRRHETNLGDLVADLMRLRTGSDAALINSGAIRASIHPGPITLEHVINSFPMNNQIITLEVTGKDLYLTLKRSAEGLAASSPADPFGGFLQVSGIRFDIVGGEIRNINIGGKPLVLYKSYKIAVLDFLAAGGDGYRELKNGRTPYNTGITLQNLFIDHLKRRAAVSVEEDGRVNIR